MQSKKKEKKNSTYSKEEKSSSKSKNSTAPTKKQKAKKKKETETESDQMEYGKMMFDDDINTFFEKIQQAVGTERAYEGLCAIQLFSMKGEPRMGTPFFPGRKVSCQVFLDKKRTHFVLVTYNPIEKCVSLYDSLYTPGDKVLKHFPQTICYQICSAYGHLAENGRLNVRLQEDYETQVDDWSCGYRSVGAVLAMYQGKDPADISYDLQSIYDFFIKVITKDSNGNNHTLSWHDILNLNIGSMLNRGPTFFYIPKCLMVNEVGYGLRKKNGKQEDEGNEDSDDDELPNPYKFTTSCTSKKINNSPNNTEEDETWTKPRRTGEKDYSKFFK